MTKSLFKRNARIEFPKHGTVAGHVECFSDQLFHNSGSPDAILRDIEIEWLGLMLEGWRQ